MPSLKTTGLFIALMFVLSLAMSPCHAAPPDNPPTAVPGRAVARVMAGGQVHLSWAAATAGTGGSVDGYEVFRNSSSIATVATDHTDLTGNLYYIDTSSSSGNVYNYEIKAFHSIWLGLAREYTAALTANNLVVNVAAGEINMYLDVGSHPGGTAEVSVDKYRFRVALCKKRRTTANAVFYTESGDTALFTDTKVNAIANRFDGGSANDLRKVDVDAFGTSLDVDGDSKVHVLIDDLAAGLGGYFWSENEKMPSAGWWSNHRELLSMSGTCAQNLAYGVAAHEFQHCIHYARDPNEETWVDEGCAGLATDLTGYFADTTWNSVEHHLQEFVSKNGDAALWPWGKNYGSSAAFMVLLRQKLGDSSFKAFVDYDSPGTAGVSHYVNYADFFAEWAVANALNNHTDFVGTNYDYHKVVDTVNLGTFEIQPKSAQDTAAPVPTLDKEEIPEKKSSLYQDESVDNTRADYWRWSAGSTTTPVTLNILLKDVDDETRAKAVLEDGDGGDKDTIVDSTSESGARVFRFRDMGVKYTRARLVVPNAQDSTDNYKLGVYTTQRPKIVSATFEQNGKTVTELVPGDFKVKIQFDQSMDTSANPTVQLDPQGVGKGAGPISIGPAGWWGNWSKQTYVDDTWTGSGTVPDGPPKDWLGTAKLIVGPAKNFNGDPLDADLVTAGDQPDTSQSVKIKAADKLDLIFTIDGTGSMGDDIAAVKVAASQIVNSLSTLVPDYRFALVNYRDFPVSPYGSPGDFVYRDVVAFTKDVPTILAGINSLGANGGNDTPEAVYSAIMHSLAYPWRDGVTKVVLVMGDAPPHDPEPFTGYTLASVVDMAFLVDPAAIYTIPVGGYTPAVYYFTELAEQTGGQVIPAANASQVVEAILDALEKITQSPLAEAGGPYSGNVGTPVNFDAGASSDPDGTILSYEWDWTGDGTYEDTTSVPLMSHTYSAPFTGQMRLRVTDNDGLIGVDSADVVIVGNKPPDCSKAYPSISQIWPPLSSKLVSVTIKGVTDPDGDPVKITILSIFQDEPVKGQCTGDVSPDGFGVGTSTAKLRAERSTKADGRVYTITFIAEDTKGGKSQSMVKVGVPRTILPKVVCIDGGPLYDSTKK